MRFHATLTHSPESCPGPRGGPPVTDWPARAAEVGIELIAAVQCQMATPSISSWKQTTMQSCTSFSCRFRELRPPNSHTGKRLDELVVFIFSV